jgi:hypothetical protein
MSAAVAPIPPAGNGGGVDDGKEGVADGGVVQAGVNDGPEADGAAAGAATVGAASIDNGLLDEVAGETGKGGGAEPALFSSAAEAVGATFFGGNGGGAEPAWLAVPGCAEPSRDNESTAGG